LKFPWTQHHKTSHYRKLFITLLVLLILLLILSIWHTNSRRSTEAHQYNAHPWVTGYLPAYHHNGREISFMDEADYAMLTHITHASATPSADGSLDVNTNSYQPDSRRLAVKLAHEHQRPILLVITGQHEQFSPAISPRVQQTFIRNILQMLDADGYDGVDIDMEPVTLDENQDNPDFTAFITELHKALQTRTSALLGRPPLLTTAISSRDRYIMASLADKFDQINLMSYDMAQPYEGWIPWFDSALHNGGLIFPGYSHQVPSVENWVNDFLAAGVPRRKLGIGISFDVACWQGGETASGQGVTRPRESWLKPPQYFKRSFADMHHQNLIPADYQWDDVAQMAWFSVDAADPAQDMFCNFNDARAIQAKIDFARQQGLGGVIIWELALDQRNDQPAGQRRPLRQALENALQQ
jgi:chitinase